MKMKTKYFLMLLISLALGVGGCTTGYVVYYNRNELALEYGLGENGPYRAWPYYAADPGSVTVYVWTPGHWSWHHGHRVWIQGSYVVRG